ncbi:MAG: gliding motility-associated C-terminal domain-containing protein, partial [Bacteroidales bacterium]|nr:gliding motility-associated C-terminal domain-containing protein [Bacteroidales bacterium]
QDLSTCTFEWDFGNGTTATGQNVNVTYNTQGSYTVTLTVTDVNACPMVETYTVDVACGGACPVCTDIIIGDPTTYTCTGTFWDSGMNSDYSNSESYTTTICSDNGGFAKIHFLEFQSESLDRLLIYDGPDNTFPLIGTYSGTAIPPDITASGTCLTYSWTSDGSVVYSGWKAELSCMHPCQDFDLNVISNPVEEADGYIHTCPGTPVDFTANLNFPNNNINYFQEDANTTISWETATGLTGTGLTFSLPADSAFSTLIFVDAEDVNGCHVYDTLYVVSECQPIDVFIATDAAVQQNGEIFLPSTSDVLSLDGSHNFPTVGGCYTQTLGQYTWTFGYTDGNGGDIYSSHAEDTVITFPMNGVYTVELQVYDQMNCFDETSIEVHVGCQPIDVSWTGSPAMLGDTVIVCPGDSFDLTIFTDYFANDILYHQEDATSVFNWNMADGTLIPNTMDFGTYSFAESGLYNINLQIQDAQGCVDNTNIPILSFMEPSLAGTTISTDTICFGDSLILYGNTTVDMPTYSAPPVFLPDGQGFAFTSTLTFDMFGDAILTDINDFESVCLNLEHSYTGDLRIRLYCPNGQFTELLPYPNGCGSNFLGEPVDNDASNTYGTGYYYCFTPTATVTIPGVAGLNTYTYTDNDGTTYTNHIYIPAGDYAPTGTFEDLIGCPLNGDWSIEVTDNLGSDNGMIFDWNITLNQDGLLPPDTVQLPMDMRVWTVETGGAAIINTFFEDDAYATPLDTGLYTFNFTVTSPAGCTYDTIVGPLYVAPMPIVNLGNDTNLCAAYTYEIPGTLSGGTGTWSFVGPGNATFSNNNSIPTTVTVDTYGTYTFLFTPNTIAACSNPEMINVTFHELPIIDAIIDSTNCYASCDGSITTNELGVEGPYNYNWSNADITPSISGLCAGVYDVEVYTAYCLNYFSYEVLQPTELMIIDSGYVDNLCFGESNGQAWISVEGGTPNYTYAWSNNGSTSSLNTALADGVYTVTVQDYYGCAKTSQITVSGPVAPLAIDEIVATDISCFGMTDGMLEPIVNGGTAPYSYHWVLTDGTISNSSTINNLQAGTYFLTVTDYNNCTTTGSQIIQESNQFIVEAFTTGTSCYGSSDGHAWVTSSGGSYPFSYAWNTGYTDSSIVNSPAANYSITVTDARGCSVSVNNIQVTQPDQVNFTIIPSAPICIGQTAQLSMSVTGSPYSPYSYYWNGNLQAETIHVSPTQTTNYTAQVIDANGCESDIKQVTVQVYNPIAISTVIDPIDICEGETVSVHVTATGGNGEYTYQLSDGQMVSESFILQPGNTSEYELVVQDNCGSPSDTSEFTINVAHTYLPSFYADIKNGCAPLEVNFIQDIQSHAEGTRYVWTFNDTEEGTIAITANTEHLFKGAGEYDVNLKIITPEGCESEKTAYNYITVYPIPKSEFVALPSVVTNVNPSVYFENHSIGANIWQWDFGDGDSTFAWNVTHMYPSVMQNYDVSLIVISDYGCRDTSYKRVKVIDEVTFYIPTGFTPDNDNRNELFRPYGTSILEEGYNMKIYDRWGEVIFETNELEKGWDGKVKDNSLAPQGVYPYMIRFVDVYGVPHERTGYINVVR